MDAWGVLIADGQKSCSIKSLKLFCIFGGISMLPQNSNNPSWSEFIANMRVAHSARKIGDEDWALRLVSAALEIKQSDPLCRVKTNLLASNFYGKGFLSYRWQRDQRELMQKLLASQQGCFEQAALDCSATRSATSSYAISPCIF